VKKEFTKNQKKKQMFVAHVSLVRNYLVIFYFLKKKEKEAKGELTDSEKLKKQIYLHHIKSIKNQKDYFDSKKENLKSDELIIIMDYKM
jgi:hypothetical protein